VIKKIVVLSRLWVEAFLKKERPIENITTEPWSLISIYSDRPLLDESNTITLKSLGCDDYLTLRFSDITKTTYNSIPEDELKTINLFTREQAHQIINFLDTIKNKVETLVVQCTAGVSRSGAVGLFAHRYLNTDEEEFWRQNKNILPNEHVLQLLMEASGLRDNYEERWKYFDDINPNNIF
jgi:predicted protein tyrosine phosphatase